MTVRTHPVARHAVCQRRVANMRFLSVRQPHRVVEIRCSNETQSGTKQADSTDSKPSSSTSSSAEQQLLNDALPVQRRKRNIGASSTDWVASSLTRRFGIVGGIAWVAFLAIGTLGEQVKTRWEVSSIINNTKDVTNAKEVTLPSGVVYKDLKIGGGDKPTPGYLVVLKLRGTTDDGSVFVDTAQQNKPIVFFFGARPFTGGLCAGLEEALSTMRAGGKRLVTVPPELGFGGQGTVLRPTEHVPDKQGVVPPNATLQYEVEIDRISIPPS